MQVRSSRGLFRTPERLDRRFSLVAGLYVASLLSPALGLIVVQRLKLTSWPVTLGLIGAVGVVLTVAIAQILTQQGDLVAWSDSAWVAVLVPAVGIIPMGVYLFDSFLFVALAVTDLQAASTTTLVSFIGFFLGIVATSLGSHLVLMARTRLANATVDNAHVAVEWTSRWPYRARLRFMAGALTVVGLLAGLAFWQLGWMAVATVLPFGVVLVIGLRSLASKRTYRATSAGLEQRKEGRWFVPRQLIPWSRFDGFSATDDAIVLHRPLPHVDVRCRRYDLFNDDEKVVAALEDHLERQGP